METQVKENQVYDLKLKSRQFREKTLYSVYYTARSPTPKRFGPIDIDGVRYRQNFETGEIDYYPRDKVESSNSASVRRSKILLNMLLDMNDFDWFATLTFDSYCVNRTNPEAVYNCYKKFIDLTKKKYPSFKYVTVPERHQDGCYHFHMVIGGLTAKQLGLTYGGYVSCSWAVKNGKKIDCCSEEYFNKTKDQHTLTDTDGEPIYNVTTFPYGHTTVMRIISRERCNTYVKKYIDKNFGSTETFKKRFFYSSNLDVPPIVERLIGSGFECPKDIDKLSLVIDSALYQYSEKQHYNENFNNMQFWVDNKYSQALEKGLIPVELLDDFVPPSNFLEEQLDFDKM